MQLTLMAPLTPDGQSTMYFYVTPGSAVVPDNSPPSASLPVFPFVPYSVSLNELHPSGLFFQITMPRPSLRCVYSASDITSPTS